MLPPLWNGLGFTGDKKGKVKQFIFVVFILGCLKGMEVLHLTAIVPLLCFLSPESQFY